MRDKGECRDWDCVGFGTSGDSGNGARRVSTAVVPKAASGAPMLTSVSKHLRRTLGALKTRVLVDGMRRPSGTRHKGFKAQERKKQRAALRGRRDHDDNGSRIGTCEAVQGFEGPTYQVSQMCANLSGTFSGGLCNSTSTSYRTCVPSSMTAGQINEFYAQPIISAIGMSLTTDECKLARAGKLVET